MGVAARISSSESELESSSLSNTAFGLVDDIETCQQTKIKYCSSIMHCIHPSTLDTDKWKIIKKWKNHFYEMKGEVWASYHEKERDTYTKTKSHPLPNAYIFVSLTNQHSDMTTSCQCFYVEVVCLLTNTYFASSLSITSLLRTPSLESVREFVTGSKFTVWKNPFLNMSVARLEPDVRSLANDHEINH